MISGVLDVLGTPCTVFLRSGLRSSSFTASLVEIPLEVLASYSPASRVLHFTCLGTQSSRHHHTSEQSLVVLAVIHDFEFPFLEPSGQQDRSTNPTRASSRTHVYPRSGWSEGLVAGRVGLLRLRMSFVTREEREYFLARVQKQSFHSTAFSFGTRRICAAVFQMRCGTKATGMQEYLEGFCGFIIQVVRF